MGMVVSLAFIPIFLLSLALPIFIGVYVYRDANKRGMNGVLWMLVAILAPTFIGLIIYLLVRSNYSDMNCPACGTRVTETYMVCPNCGTKLRPTCPSCATPVQPEWKVCPQCAEPLPTTYSGVTTPEKPKDKTLFKVLIAILLVPVLLVVLIIALMTGKLSFSASSHYEGYGTHSMPFYEFEQEFLSDDVKNWLEDCRTMSSREDVCAVLRYVSETTDHAHVEYLVYIPGAGPADDIRLDTENHLFREDVFTIGVVSPMHEGFDNLAELEEHKKYDPYYDFVPYIYHITYDSSKMPPSQLEVEHWGDERTEYITDTLLPFYSEEQKDLYYEEMQRVEPVA